MQQISQLGIVWVSLEDFMQPALKSGVMWNADDFPCSRLLVQRLWTWWCMSTFNMNLLVELNFVW